RVKITGDYRLGDVPVVANTGKQQTAFFVDVIPVESDVFFLIWTERFVKLLDQRLGRALSGCNFGGRCLGRLGRLCRANEHIGQADRASSERGRSGRLHEIAPAEEFAQVEKLKTRFAVG